MYKYFETIASFCGSTKLKTAVGLGKVDGFFVILFYDLKNLNLFTKYNFLR